MNETKSLTTYPARRWMLIFIFIITALLLVWRAVYLQVQNKDFLRNHGDARSLRVVTIPAHRGVITDRNNESLAISTPVDSIWANPKRALKNMDSLGELAQFLKLDSDSLIQTLQERSNREFVYLKRHISPDQALAISALDVDGINLQREYKRYYPAGDVAAHLIGFTDIDDSGQEGIELAYDQWLKGVPGEKRVLKDRLGRTVQNIESIQSSSPGRSLALSIDRRVQYLAYRELKRAIEKYNARSGSIVILDSKLGEVIALVVQPSFNPNNRTWARSEYFRNRVVTDVFEPGSTLKPFTVATALVSGMYKPETIIETRPGFLKVNNHVIEDVSNLGTIDVTGVIKKSSNVGASKISLSLGPKPLWELYRDVGFGIQTSSGYPGESPGILSSYTTWSELELATIAFGHGIAVTSLQLAQAYSVIANYGILKPVSFLKVNEEEQGVRVLPEVVAKQVLAMLESAVNQGGTGQRANIPLYRVAGKTGTSHKATAGGYAENKYLSLFAGIAPVSEPRLVMIVSIDEPQGQVHFGGQVAAPVFSTVMEGALRILDIAPDDLHSIEKKMLMAYKNGSNQFR